MATVLEAITHGVFRASGAKSRFVETSRGRVHAYEIEGRGEGTFVLLHGLGNSGTAYAAVLQKLRRSAARMIVPDLPGHGRSEPRGRASVDPTALTIGMREALDALLEPARPAVLLGTSLGGGVALGYALERADRVRALVLASPAGAPLSAEELVDLRKRFGLKTRDDARRFLAELLHAPPWYVRLIEPSLVDLVGRPLVQDFLASLGAGEFFTREQLAALVSPTTLLWGKSDRILPRSSFLFYRDALPPSTVVEELEGVGHSPHFERPAVVVEKLLAAYRTSTIKDEPPGSG